MYLNSSLVFLIQVDNSKYQQKLKNELKKLDKEQDSYRKYVDEQLDTYREDLKLIKEKMSKIKSKQSLNQVKKRILKNLYPYLYQN